MFSGIVEEAAQVVALQSDKGNLHLTMKCSFVNELKIDQSVAHNGVCLTVVSMTEDTYTVTAIKETLERSNLGNLKVGDKVNLERSMLMNGRLDGHIVQGHVDQTAVCAEVKVQPHWVPATWRSLAQTSIRAEFPSGNVPTTRVRRRISRFSRSITLLVRMRVQCSLGKSQ